MYLFRKDLQALQAPRISVPKAERMMCLNESCLNPYPVIEQSFREILKFTGQNRYQSEVSDLLQTELAGYAGLQQEQLLFGNGADDMIYHLLLSVRDSEDSFALSLAPSYFDYKTFALEVGLKIRFLALDEDFHFDKDQYLALAMHPDCKLAILCNPNNPTGNLFPQKDLLYIAENLPDTLVMVDETYYEFSGASLKEYLDKYPNLILIRSFSKAFSAAGLRFGYALSCADNIAELRKVQSTFHTSLLVQAFALGILRNKQTFLNQVREVIDMKEDLYLWLKSIPGLKVHYSKTNFLSFSLGAKSRDLFRYLLDDGIALRDVGAHPILKDHLRVTISCREDIARFRESLQNFLREGLAGSN